MPTDHSQLLLTLVSTLLLPTACFDPLVDPPPAETDGTGSSTTDPSPSSSGLDESGDSAVALCGDGIVEGDELCDDGLNDGSYGGCAPGCTALGPYCGDGILNGPEPCDDGDDQDGNGCNVDCVVSGSVLWTVTYDGPNGGADIATDVAADSTGAVIVSGYSQDTGAWLRKHDPDGSLQWHIQTDLLDGGAAAVTVGDRIVLGGSYRPAPDVVDAWLQAFDPGGQSSWAISHTSAFDTDARVTDLDVDPEGFIYALFQETEAPTESGYRTFVRKYDSNGMELWTETQDDTVRARKLATDGAGNLTILGSSFDGQDESLWLQRLSSDGVESWATATLATSLTFPTALDVGSQGDIVLSAWSAGQSAQALRVTSEGTVISTLDPYPNPSDVGIVAMHLEDDGSLLLGGAVTNDGMTQGWISRYSSDDVEIWTKTHDGPFDTIYAQDIVLSISVDPSGNVLAAGNIMHHPNLNGDAWITKYAP